MYPHTWTTDSLRDVFSPGRELHVLMEGRRSWQNQAVRRSVVLDADEDELTMSKPSPPLPPPLLGQALEITVLVERGPGAASRFAYASSILDELPAPGGASGAKAAVVVMFPRPEDMYATCLRKAKRFEVTPQSPVRLWLGDQPLNLMDISPKGLRFCGGEVLAGLRPGDEMKLKLVIHDEPQRVHGRVTAVNPAPRGVEISLELGILPLDAWTSLVEVLNEMEQAQAGQGSKA